MLGRVMGDLADRSVQPHQVGGQVVRPDGGLADRRLDLGPDGVVAQVAGGIGQPIIREVGLTERLPAQACQSWPTFGHPVADHLQAMVALADDVHQPECDQPAHAQARVIAVRGVGAVNTNKHTDEHENLQE